MTNIIDKKYRLAIYELALEYQTKGAINKFMCPNLYKAACENGIHMDVVDITPFLPEFHSMRPKHIREGKGIIWFYTDGMKKDLPQYSIEEAQAKRILVLEKCISAVKEPNPLPAFQNENLRKVAFKRSANFTS